MTLRAEEIFAVLHQHEVRYVVIGGLGAVLHGSPIVTQDADICPARDRTNLDRLAAALSDLQARLRVANAPEGIAFPFEGAFLANVQLLNLTTRRHRQWPPGAGPGALPDCAATNVAPIGTSASNARTAFIRMISTQ